MTLDEIKAALLRMDPDFDESDEIGQAQIVMASALEVGTSVRKLRQFTGVPTPAVSKFVQNLRSGGVFNRGKVHANWFDEKLGGTAFVLDAMVATGLMERAD